jgi:uncharacterized protein DUF4339
MSAPAAQVQWYLARDGQQYGPLSELELARFIELGHLQPTDLLWREGFPDWRPAMIVFPRNTPAAPRPAPAPRPGPQPARQPSSPRVGERARPYQAQGTNAAAKGAQLTPRHRRVQEPESEERGGGGLRKALLIVVCFALLGAAGWYAYPHRASLMTLAKTLPPRVVALLPSLGGKGQDVISLKEIGGPPESIDARLQRAQLWRIVKQEFPDWYADRLKETAALVAEAKGEAAIGQHLARSVVGLRRQNVAHALAAGFPRLKAIAATFHDNLIQLRKHSVEACFAFISQGEASPTVVGLMQEPALAAHLQAQLTAVFEAIAEGRKTARVYPQPRKSDYDTLAADLAKRGWTQTDMQLFSDERALSSASPEKVCQLVNDWFAAQLDLKDPDMQLRLLVDSLKPVVAG